MFFSSRGVIRGEPIGSYLLVSDVLLNLENLDAGRELPV
jgi:hypothetical protein